MKPVEGTVKQLVLAALMKSRLYVLSGDPLSHCRAPVGAVVGLHLPPYL
jgi:hypothetical protein